MSPKGRRRAQAAEAAGAGRPATAALLQSSPQAAPAGAPRTTPTGTTATQPAPARAEVGPQDRSGSRRRTVIAPSVVTTLASVAASRVPGVHGLGAGGGSAGTLGRVRGALPGGASPAGDGVQVEIGEVQAAFDLVLVAEYGAPIARLAGDVREAVVRDVEELAGYEVTEVNVAVVDVHLDEEDDR